MRWSLLLLFVGSLFVAACSDDDYGKDLGNGDAGASTDGAIDLSSVSTTD
jgi:hypothetical protein